MILLLGDRDRPEFREACAVLDTLSSPVCKADQGATGVSPVSDVGQIANLPRDWQIGNLPHGTGNLPVAPEVIVLLQAYPGQFSHADLDRLQRQYPLSRLVLLLGTWCEGEKRSGQPWPAAVRLYWHQGPERLRQELGRLTAGRGSAWGLPVTATEEERLLAASEVPLPQGQGLIAIGSFSPEMADWLAAACRSSGHATVWIDPRHPARLQGAVAAIYDAAETGEADFDALQQFVGQIDPAPVAALLGFPRIDDYRRAIEAGAAAVLSKPLAVDDLAWRIEEMIAGCHWHLASAEQCTGKMPVAPASFPSL